MHPSNFADKSAVPCVFTKMVIYHRWLTNQCYATFSIIMYKYLWFSFLLFVFSLYHFLFCVWMKFYFHLFFIFYRQYRIHAECTTQSVVLSLNHLMMIDLILAAITNACIWDSFLAASRQIRSIIEFIMVHSQFHAATIKLY